MTALTAAVQRKRRGAPPTAKTFGYTVAPGQKVYQGGLVCMAGTVGIQPIGTQGTVTAAFAGMADGSFDNTGTVANPPTIECVKGTFQLDVTATLLNIGQAVYATDDTTLTLTAGSNVKVGTLVGIESGKTWIELG